MRTRGDWGGIAVAYLAVFAPVAALLWRLRQMAFDDAFIHLRVARNLARHGVAAFNPGERVMTTSSPLWTLVLTMLRIDAHRWLLPWFEAALLAACGVLAYRLSRRPLRGGTNAARSEMASVLLALICGALCMLLVVPSAVGQMETPLAMALLLGAACCAADGGTRGAGCALPLLALAACTRLELLPLLLAGCVVGVIAKVSVRSLLVAIGVVIAMALAVYAQFGALLPNSMRAKSIGYGFDRADILLQIFEARFLLVPLAVCLIVFFGGVAWGRLRASRGRTLFSAASLPFFAGAWGACVMLEYIVRRTPIFEWYRPLVWLPWLLCLLLYREAKESSWWVRVPMESARWMALGLVMLVPLWKASALVRAAIEDTAAARSVEDRGDSARVQQYLAVGRALRESCPAGGLMTAEIGALGWAFDGYVYDAFGIATPRALAFQPLHSGAPRAGIPDKFAVEVMPDLVVSYAALDVEVRNDAALMARYDLIELLPELAADRVSGDVRGWHGSTSLDVMVRRDGRCDVGAVERAVRAAESGRSL